MERVYQIALIARVITRISVNGPGPTIQYISLILYRSTRSTSIFGNVEAVSRFFGSVFVIISSSIRRIK